MISMTALPAAPALTHPTLRMGYPPSRIAEERAAFSEAGKGRR
jgi:hypothetical protein